MTPSDWTRTADAAQIAAWLDARPSVAVLTHIKPDGDAVGSTVALARALNIAAGGSAAGFSGVAAKAEIWYAGPLPGWLSAIARDTKHRAVDRGLPAAEPEAFAILDTGSWSQLEPYRPALEGATERAAIVDHHLKGDGEIANRRLIDTAAAAACQITADICCCLLKKQSPRELPVDVAEPLYLGLATDTGWFRHANTSPAVLRLAADLIEAGVDHERLHTLIEERERPGRLRLLARALDSLELLADGSLAVITLRPADFAAANAAPGESGGFLDIVRTLEGVRVAALLTEMQEDGRTITKVSLRSKGGPGMVDVNKVAGALGGGGHAQAAGARVTGSLEVVKTRLLEVLTS